MSLTKQDIDALVEKMPRRQKTVTGMAGLCAGVTEGVAVDGIGYDDVVSMAGLRRTLYLAAGLTAEGERKPERVRCWIYSDSSGKCLTMVEPGCGESRWKFTPGWFVPSEEGET